MSWTMVNGRRRAKRRRRSQQGSSDSSTSDTLSPDPNSNTHGEGNLFETLDENTTETDLSATAGIIAQANSIMENPGVDQNLVDAIGKVVDEKLKGAVAEIKNDFAKKLSETVSKLEDRVKRVEEENKKLRDAVENLPLGEVGDPDTIGNFIRDSVEAIMKEKEVLTREEFDYSRTLLATGVTEWPGEDPMKVAEQLLDKGLGKSNLKIVRAKRIPTTRKPGPFKIELESEQAKKEALAETAKLQFYKAQGNKVIVRSSQRFEDRVQTGNWNTLLRAQGLEGQYRVSKHGKLLPNTYAQQRQQQQVQTQQQQSQAQQQYQVQQQQFQFQQQQPQMLPSQQLQPQQQVWQQQQQMPTQTGQVVYSQFPNTNTYSSAVQSQPQHAQKCLVTPATSAQHGVQTNHFRFSIPPPRTTASGH